MRDFPSCFGETGVQVADSSHSHPHRTPQNSVTGVYQCRIRGRSSRITTTWSRNRTGQVLHVGIDDSSDHWICKVDFKPRSFSKRRGCENLEAYSRKVAVFWDLTSAQFGSGPEPLDGYYVGVVVDEQTVFLIGDLAPEALKQMTSPPPSPPVLVLRREHILGKKTFPTKAFLRAKGPVRDLVIECDTAGVTDPSLVLRVDGNPVMRVTRLRWNFRGNRILLIDGVAVEILWDVHDWLFTASIGNAVFLFRACSSPDAALGASHRLGRPIPNPNPNLSQSSFSQKFSDSKFQQHGFSWIVHAWKNE